MNAYDCRYASNAIDFLCSNEACNEIVIPYYISQYNSLRTIDILTRSITAACSLRICCGYSCVSFE